MADSFVAVSFVPDASAKPQPKTTAPTKTADEHSPLWGGVLDTFGLTDRPGKRTAAGALLNPQGVAEHLASLAVQAPLIGLTGGAGAAVGIPAAAGRMAAAGGLGALSASQRGDSMGWGALLDATVAGLTEGAGKMVTAGRIPFTHIGLKDMGAPARAFEWATKAPEKALELIRSKLPSVRFEVPSMGKGKLSIDEAVEKLSTMTGTAYEMARAELADAFSRAEAAMLKMSGAAKPLGPKTGQTFKHFTAKERFEPKTAAKVAEGTRRVLATPAAQSVADAVTTQPVLDGWPAGIIPLMGVGENLGEISHRALRSVGR